MTNLSARIKQGLTFRGKRFGGGIEVVVTENDFLVSLPWRLDLRNHSPTGFEWGYGGSGPAQLALAILSYAMENNESALEFYQAFKWKFIGAIKEDEWRLTSKQIEIIIDDIMMERRKE